MPVVNGKAGESSERPEVELLPHGLIGVIGTGTHPRREILDFRDGVFGKQKLTELSHIHPPIWCFAEGSVVEVKPVYVHIGCNKSLQTCKSRPEAASRPATEATGGICFTI